MSATVACFVYASFCIESLTLGLQCLLFEAFAAVALPAGGSTLWYGGCVWLVPCGRLMPTYMRKEIAICCPAVCLFVAADVVFIQ